MASSVVTASPQSEPFEWVQQALFAAFGAGTPLEQMVFSFIFFVLAFVWTAIGLVFTAILDVLFAFLFFVGLARFLLAESRR